MQLIIDVFQIADENDVTTIFASV